MGACVRDPGDSRYFAGFFRSPRVAFLADSFVVFLQFIQLFVRELFHVNQLVTGRMVRAEKFYSSPRKQLPDLDLDLGDGKV